MRRTHGRWLVQSPPGRANGWGVVGRTNADQKVGVWGDNIGGPVIIPKLLDSRTSKKKVFFFFSQEYWPLRISQPITMPITSAATNQPSPFISVYGIVIPPRDLW